MSEISRDDVVSIFGSTLSDATIAQIIATGATSAELTSARDWIAKDAAHTIADRSLQPSPMSHVIDIIERVNSSRHSGTDRSPLGRSGSTLE